jgi:hypothetical protein
MPRATYQDLIRQVRAQIAVDEDTAWSWLLDRSRVLNAEANWLVMDGFPLEPYGGFTEPDEIGRFWMSTDDLIWIEAVWAGDPLTPTVVYQRSTPHAMDARTRGDTGNIAPIYCSSLMDSGGGITIEVNPAWTTDGFLYARGVYDVLDDRTAAPPFPTDFDQALVEGTISMGLARMDERFDSASYMDGRFQSAVGRLRRRRHARVGRGATAIRVVQ